jgi:hypothetical protein
MCLDPISLGLLGTGILGSVGGGIMQNKAMQTQQGQQLNQNLAAEEARNQTLQRFLQTQKGYQKDNTGVLNSTIAGVQPGAVAGAQSSATQNRSTAANQAIDNGIQTTQAPPISGAGSSVVQGAMNDRSNAAIGTAKAGAAAQSAVGSYGDENTNMNLQGQDAARKIDTTNSFARGDAALLPYEQQLADFQARVSNPVNPASTMGSAVEGLGNVFASLAGSGKLKNISMPWS